MLVVVNLIVNHVQKVGIRGIQLKAHVKQVGLIVRDITLQQLQVALLIKLALVMRARRGSLIPIIVALQPQLTILNFLSFSYYMFP